jgi:hypothetical protein
MKTLSFDIANNWKDFPEYKRDVAWQTASQNDEYIVFIGEVEKSQWKIRINDFPDEPLYTLIVDGKEKLHFDDWPEFWEKPEYPRKKGVRSADDS